MAATLCATLAACAGTAPGGRPQLTAPPAVSSLYSSVDMEVRMAVVAPLAENCTRKPCVVDRTFDRQVALVGARLARAAYEIDPQLRQRVRKFSFVVADKAQPGSASDSQGTIVIFRGTGRSNPDDRALAYLIAREMGHVIARHHEEKSATSILLSIVIQLLMPVTSLTGGMAVLTGTTASVVGSEVVSARNDDQQAKEADTIAYELLKRQGWSGTQLSASLANYAKGLGSDNWSDALRHSMERFARQRGAPERKA